MSDIDLPVLPQGRIDEILSKISAWSVFYILVQCLENKDRIRDSVKVGTRIPVHAGWESYQPLFCKILFCLRLA